MDEIVRLRKVISSLQTEMSSSSSLQAELNDLKTRYSTALEIIGSKEEEIVELRADVLDMKNAFRQQISLLLERMEIMEKSK